jgi:hypothetical protein
MRTTRARSRYGTTANPIAIVIRIVTGVIVAILVLHIILVLLEANPGNSLVQTMADWADGLAGWSRDLFTPDSYKARIFINEGLAAVVYALIGGALSRAATRI